MCVRHRRSPREEAAMTATYITTTIPYVNARPHIGHALEFVQADVLARYRRARGEDVRFQSGTDDNSLKNVLAAEAAGTPVRAFVDRNAGAFAALGGALSLTVDDFIRTSRDPGTGPASSVLAGLRPGPVPPAVRGAVLHRLRAAIFSGELRIELAGRRNEVLAFID